MRPLKPEMKTGNLKNYSYTKVFLFTGQDQHQPSALMTNLRVETTNLRLAKCFCPDIESQVAFSAATMVPPSRCIPAEQMRWGGSLGQEAEQLHKPDLLNRTHSQSKTKENYRTNCS